MYRVGRDETSTQGLANAEEIALAVFEPRTLFTDSLAGIISCDFGDSIYGLKAGQIVFFESHATRLERRYGRLNISNLPAHLGVTARCLACGFEQSKEMIAAPVVPLFIQQIRGTAPQPINYSSTIIE